MHKRVKPKQYKREVQRHHARHITTNKLILPRHRKGSFQKLNWQGHRLAEPRQGRRWEGRRRRGSEGWRSRGPWGIEWAQTPEPNRELGVP